MGGTSPEEAGRAATGRHAPPRAATRRRDFPGKVIHKVYIPGMRDFQGFNWVVTAKVAHLTGFEKYQSHIVVGCLLFYCVIILPKEVILC